MKEDFLFNIVTILIILFFILLQSKRKTHFIRSVQLQNCIWLFAFSLYLLNIVPYHSLNEIVYVSAILYLCSFNLASLFKPTRIHLGKEKAEIESINDSKRVKKCICASFICWICSINILRKSIPVLLQFGVTNGFNALRYRTYGEYTIFTTPEMMLMTYVIRPIFTVTIILMAEEVAQRRINIKLIVVAVLDAFWLIIATAGRALLVSMIIYVLLAIIVLNGTNILKLINRYKRYIIPICALLVIILYVFSKRINRDNGLVTEGIIYFFSGPHYFSTLIEQELAGPYQLMGKGTFSFLLDVPFLFLKMLGISDFSLGSQYISTLTNSVLPIGENLTTNATASTLLVFYSDFGLLGSILGGFLMGRIATNIENKCDKCFSPITFGKYLYVLAGVAISIQNYPFIGGVATMTWLFIILLLR